MNPLTMNEPHTLGAPGSSSDRQAYDLLGCVNKLFQTRLRQVYLTHLLDGNA